MARYKDYNYDQSKLLPINFSEQILPGSFEYTVNYLVDNELDLTIFESRYNNDETGSPAYDPAILLKIILAAYARGFTSSRSIERLCRENIIFMALSADSQPHFTTIAGFITTMSDVIQPLFLEVLMVCGNAGLIGEDMFAIDGCKLPSNASKDWSGTHADLTKKQQKIDRAVRRMLTRHKEEDSKQINEPEIRRKDEAQIKKLKAISKKIKKHLTTTDEKLGCRGTPIKSNITDNESAKMKTSHGVIQGYVGVSAVDSKNQIIIAAEAFGQCQEHDLLEPIVQAAKEHLGQDYIEKAKLTADSGFHNTNNVAFCQEENIDAYIADKSFRSRDPRFKDYNRFKPKTKQKKYFVPADFTFNKERNSCHCPAGKKLWQSQTNIVMGDQRYHRFEGYLNDCKQCTLQKKCMRKTPTNRGRQVSIRTGEAQQQPPSLLKQMQEKIDSRKGRHIYSQRIGTVEPVFGNINTNKRLNRFSLRGKTKVNAQWLMYCMVHNIEKIQHYGSIH
jgi:transposase